VVRVADDHVICDLVRNLDIFHHTFVTKGDRELLIAGRSYMSQTIVDLDRGLEHEPPGDHHDGSGFCWIKCSLSPDGTTLAVDGCVWACPYEIRFFDFTDPARGWPELPIVGGDTVDPSDARPPVWVDARTVDVHRSDREQAPQERTRLERRGQAMIAVDHWVSGDEQVRRANEARARGAQDAWWEAFRATEAMYLRLVELVRVHALPSSTLGLRPGAHRIIEYFRREDPRASADLHWDLDEATLTVQLYDAAGTRARQEPFPHTIAGIEAAVALIATMFG
jgi:hypothetical protein